MFCSIILQNIRMKKTTEPATAVRSVKYGPRKAPAVMGWAAAPAEIFLEKRRGADIIKGIRFRETFQSLGLRLK